jgi:hydroxyethylthiazole kinase-like uncharacterized protein yjeF
MDPGSVGGPRRGRVCAPSDMQSDLSDLRTPVHELPPFPRRARDAHKRSVGTVLVVAGSRGMTGAAYLAGKGALRTGAGLVRIACPESANRVLEVKTVCVMTRPLPETGAGTLAQGALEPLLKLALEYDALAIGPGLGAEPETHELVRELVARVAESDVLAQRGVVLDADALNAFAEHRGALRALAGRCVLTPHWGEFRRLSGCTREALAEDREGVLRGFVEETGVTTLLKGPRTLILSPGEGDGPLRRHVNESGNPGMATGGTGDVLTGVIGALLAAGLGPHDAARLGAHLHGRAGDFAARRVGWAPMSAADVLEGLVEVIRAIEVRA